MTPKVTIGVPVRNGGAFFVDCLASIESQTLADFEVIISDNASNDGTSEVAQSLAERDPRVRYVRSERNEGSAANWDRVVELAGGTYFKWLAADDLIAPAYLERCVAILDRHPDVVLVTPRIELIDADGRPLVRVRGTNRYSAPHGETLPEPRSTVTSLASRSALRRFRGVVVFLREPDIAANAMSLIRSDALRSTMLFEPYVGSDKVVLAQLSLVGRFGSCAETLSAWRIHPGHMGSKTPAEFRRQMDPTWTGRHPLVGLHLVIGYLRAIRSADVSALVKLGCVAVIVEKVTRGLWSHVRRRGSWR